MHAASSIASFSSPAWRLCAWHAAPSHAYRHMHGACTRHPTQQSSPHLHGARDELGCIRDEVAVQAIHRDDAPPVVLQVVHESAEAAQMVVELNLPRTVSTQAAMWGVRASVDTTTLTTQQSKYDVMCHRRGGGSNSGGLWEINKT